MHAFIGIPMLFEASLTLHHHSRYIENRVNIMGKGDII